MNGCRYSMIYRECKGDDALNDHTDWEQNIGAVAVVSQQEHTIFYYSLPMMEFLRPSAVFQSGMTFEDFFADDPQEVQLLFEHCNQGSQLFYCKNTEQRFDVTVVSVNWKGQPAIMLSFRPAAAADKSDSVGNAEKRMQFEAFLCGEENTIPFEQCGSKVYSVWNMTKGTLEYASDGCYAFGKVGPQIEYDQFYQMYCNHIASEEDRKQFEYFSADNVKKFCFEGKTIPDRIIRMDWHMNDICLHFTPSVGIHPDNGDVYIKHQIENVTDHVLFEKFLKSSAGEFTDLMAYINGSTKRVYYLIPDEVKNNTDIYSEGRLDEQIGMLAEKMGGSFDNAEALFGFLESRLEDKNEVSFTNRLSHNRSVHMHIWRLRAENRQYIVSCKDITEILNAEAISYFDDLTGLPNMTHFRNIAMAAGAEMKSKGILPAYVYFDLRDMKAVNENYGFAKGNGILIGTAYVLSAVFKGDPVSRFADDHFVVLTNRKLLEQKLEKVHEQVLNNPTGIPVQICAGIYIDDDRQKLDVIAACDRARLACKSLKGDYQHKYKIFDRAMFDEYHQRQHILTHFEEALEKGWIKVYYQPIIRTITGNICDMEALSRWVDPEKGMLPPSQFIPVLEEHRLITKLDFYMLTKICENLRRQKQEKLPVVPVSVNLSRLDFEECDVVEEVLKIVDEYGVSHKLLTIEITESAFINNRYFLSKQIQRFRQAGFGVWMDDFGSEYSSLNTLQEFDFDLIKLDMTFMKNFSLTGKNHSILSDVVGMVSRLGIHTLAEGVQTKEQLNFLSDIGCEKAQGYLFSRPMPCEYFADKASRDIGIQYDDIRQATYYDKIGSVNFKDSILMELDDSFSHIITGIPAAVMEYRSGKFKILKSNEAYKNFLSMIQVEGGQKEENGFVQYERQPSERFRQTARRCFQSGHWETITDDTEGKVSVSSRLLSIAYDTHTEVGAILVVINRTYRTDEETLSAENEYHFNTNLLWMAGRGLASLLGYRSIYDFLMVSCYFHINLTLNKIEEIHLSKDDKRRMDAWSFHSYDELTEKLWENQSSAVLTEKQKEMFERTNLIHRFIGGETTVDTEFRLIYDEEPRWKHMICRMSQSDGQIHGWFFMYDINDFTIRNQAMKQRAELDGLTGLFNRSTVEDKIGEYLAQNPLQSCAVVMMDIDGFKHFDDHLGHRMGDSVLKETASLLKQIFGEDSIIGRVGGDEFMLLVKNTTPQQAAERIEKMQSLPHRVESGGKRENFTVSTGFAMYPAQGRDFQELYRRADLAMYAVKTDVKGKYKQFHPSMSVTDD